jgi:hypothetical protein
MSFTAKDLDSFVENTGQEEIYDANDRQLCPEPGLQ